jgi:threonine dehydratase
VTGFFVVGEEEILQAMQFADERLKLVIEPSSAVALVPLLRQEPQLVGKRVGVVLTGGNVERHRPWPGLDGTETMQRSDG